MTTIQQLAHAYEQAGDALDLATAANRASAYAEYTKARDAYEAHAGEAVTLAEAQEAEQALTLALKLAIQAPSETKAAQCVEIAERIAKSMTHKQVEICKAAAECAVEYENTFAN